MRALGLGLVVASLALSVGGVSVRPAAAETPAVADTQAPAAAPDPVVEIPPTVVPEPANACKVTAPAPIVITLERDPFNTDDYIPLNTRGYNYPASDDPPERFGASSVPAPAPQPKP